MLYISCNLKLNKGKIIISTDLYVSFGGLLGVNSSYKPSCIREIGTCVSSSSNRANDPVVYVSYLSLRPAIVATVLDVVRRK